MRPCRRTPQPGVPTNADPSNSCQSVDSDEQWSKLHDNKQTPPPSENFYQFVNGEWLKKTSVPHNKAEWGTFNILREENNQRVHQLLVSADISDSASPSELRDISQARLLYRSFITGDGKEELLQKILQVRECDSMVELKRMIVDLQIQQMIDAPFVFGVDFDLEDSSRKIVWCSTGGLHMPAKTFYRRSNPIVESYRTLVDNINTRLMTLLESSTPVLHTETLLQFERSLAKRTHSAAQSLNPQIYGNKVSYEEFRSTYPHIPIEHWLSCMTFTDQVAKGNVDLNNGNETKNWKGKDGTRKHVTETPYGVTWMNVTNPRLLNYINRSLSRSETLGKWKQHVIWSLALRLHMFDSRVRALRADFFGRVLSGVDSPPPLWARAVQYVNRALGEVVGMEYCRRYFPPHLKQRCEEMVRCIMEELRTRLSRRDNWMDASTRREALRKLDNMRVKIGYPEPEGRADWSDLVLSEEESFYENHRRVNVFQTLCRFRELHTGPNPHKFVVHPHTINALYSALRNEIVFPAGILQFPFFDKDNHRMPENFGAIGAVIGHEITHAFDTSGRRFDSTGTLRNWWTEDADAAFSARADRLERLYSSFTCDLHGVVVHVDGKLTLSENIADIGGATLAFHAMKRYIANADNGCDNGGEIATRNTPWTPARGEGGGLSMGRDTHAIPEEQRFFFSFARMWKNKVRTAEAKKRLATDPHAPPAWRVNGTCMNMPEFYTVFDVSSRDDMFLPPTQRVAVW